MEMTFDEALVLQQLRYTGMLETVRIRRSGYSAKYPYQVNGHPIAQSLRIIIFCVAAKILCDILYLLGIQRPVSGAATQVLSRSENGHHIPAT